MLRLENGWVRAGRDDVTGFFGTLHNSSDHDITVRGGHSPAADAVELHDIAEVDARKQMIHLTAGITIPAHVKVTLAPGGLHGMLIGLHRRIEEHENVVLALDTSAGRIEVLLPGHRKPPASGAS